jgi:hypothetical protein
MAVFVSHSDETDEGHHRSMFWHCGLIAPEQDWSAYFNPAWQEDVLDSPPAIPYLHVSEIRDSEWRAQHGLSYSQMHEKLDAAAHVINTTGSLIPLGIKANAGVFLDLFRDYKMVKSKGEKAKRFLIDHLCFNAYTGVVLLYAKHTFPDLEKVDFVVDRKDGVFDKQKELYETLEAVLPALGHPELVELLGEIIPSDPENRIPLQAADFLCWHTGRSKDLEGRNRDRYYPIAHRPGFMHHYPDHDLRKLAEVFKERMSTEFEKFDTTMQKLISVPHNNIKAALGAEQRMKAKKKKRKANTKSSASARDSRQKG